MLNQILENLKSSFTRNFFYYYTKIRLKTVFKRISFSNDIKFDNNKSAILFGNHNSWWDALTPLLMQKLWFPNHNLIALMEEKQFIQFPFFKYLGAVPVKSSSLNISTWKRIFTEIEKKNTVLFIYPEGKLVSPYNKNKALEKGLFTLYKKYHSNCDFYCINQFVDFSKGPKPILDIKYTLINNHDITISADIQDFNNTIIELLYI